MEGNGNSIQPENRENPNPNPNPREEAQEQDETAPREQQASSRRTPFTNLSQVEADLALARTLQEQERAYMMLRMSAEGGSDYGSWEGGSYFNDDDEEEEDDDEDDFGDPETVNDEVDSNNNNNDNNNSNNNNNNNNNHNDDDAGDRNINNSEQDEENDDVGEFNLHIHDDDDDDDDEEEEEEEEEDEDDLEVVLDPALFTSDEAYARALQDAEEREMAARLFALTGMHDLVSEVQVREDQGGNSQDMWEEVDTDEYSYEELLALSEVVGTESRGLSADTIASLPSIKYKTGSSQNGRNDSCVICRLDYEDDETVTLLSCKHSYHPECLNNWLKINKVCPVCSTEVSSSGTV